MIQLSTPGRIVWNYILSVIIFFMVLYVDRQNGGPWKEIYQKWFIIKISTSVGLNESEQPSLVSQRVSSFELNV